MPDIHTALTQLLSDAKTFADEFGELLTAATCERLMRQLQNRGWQWSYGPGGHGYEVYTRRTIRRRRA